MPNSKIWDTYDKNFLFYERAKLSYFTCTFKNGIWIAQPKRHVTSTHDVSLCLKDQTNMVERKKIERKGELLDKLAKPSDSEPLDIFLTSEFLLKSKVLKNLNTQTDVTTR